MTVCVGGIHGCPGADEGGIVRRHITVRLQAAGQLRMDATLEAVPMRLDPFIIERNQTVP